MSKVSASWLFIGVLKMLESGSISKEDILEELKEYVAVVAEAVLFLFEKNLLEQARLLLSHTESFFLNKIPAEFTYSFSFLFDIKNYQAQLENRQGNVAASLKYLNEALKNA